MVIQFCICQSWEPLTAEAWILTKASACGIGAGQSSSQTGFSPDTSVFPCQYHPTSGPCLFHHSSLMLYNPNI